MATGTLFIVATPIGNLEDITLRALRTLREADVIACEDTRTTGKLLSRYEIKKPLTSYHEHNEETKTPELIERLKSGESVALVTDAGTPGVSDPGYRLIRAAIEAKIPITPVPGATALITALAASGLSTHRFAFFGFMERGENKKREFLTSIRNYLETLIFYESPHRILSTLKAIEEVLGDRAAALSRELTKVHEETIRGTLSEIIEELSQREKIKGEVTILIRGAEGGAEKHSTHSLRRLLQEKRGLGKTLKDAVGEVCEETNAKKNVVYGLALELWKE